MIKKLVFTSGDIAGIGPEVICKAISKVAFAKKVHIVITGPAKVFIPYLKQYCPEKKIEITDSFIITSASTEIITVVDIPSEDFVYGIPSAATGLTSLSAITKAHQIVCSDIVNTAMITAPVSKTAMNMAGGQFPGHTEMLAFLSGIDTFAMMFLSSKMCGALLTIHEPLSNVSRLMSIELLEKKLMVIVQSLHDKFGIKKPRIALLGLNPHAGEDGNIGREEIDIFIPFIMKYKFLNGPFPADGFFGSGSYKNYDVVISPYHDQLLVAFKILAFSEGVNFTAGLPFVRTSPDHGTAFNIAGKDIADPSSMIAATKWAIKLLKVK